MILSGYKVILSYPFPKMTLSEKVPVTQEFRNEINGWMRSFFGVTHLVERGKAIVMEDTKTIVMHPADYAAIQQGKDNK